MNKLKLILIAMLAVSILSGCATVPSKLAVKPNEVLLKDLCEQEQIGLEWDNVARVVTLKFLDQKAKFLVGSNIVLIGSEKITLSAITRVQRSNIIVPLEFKVKVIERLKPPRKVIGKVYPMRRVREVIIDPGHGGKDPGAISRRGTKEKDIVLDVSRRLKRSLEKQGIKVKITRNKDEFLSLQERTEVACRSKADLFVSIHANSSPVKSVSGMEIYSLRDLEYSERNESQRKANSRLYYNQVAMKKNDSDLENIVGDLMYSNKQAESASLSQMISSQVPKAVKNKSRGTKHARFYVLRNTMIPAVLVEIGYLTNVQEEKDLRNPMYRQKLASALANSIASYVRSRR